MAQRVAAVALALGLTIGVMQMAPAEEMLSPLVATPIASPNPVLGADDKIHLAYEIVLLNLSSGDLTLEKVEAIDTLDGDALTKMVRLNAGAKGTELPAGGSGVLFMDVTLDQNASIPKAVKHRFKIEVVKAPPRADSSGTDHDPSPNLRRRSASSAILSLSGLRPSWWRRRLKVCAG
jgi:hypothetical protein